MNPRTQLAQLEADSIAAGYSRFDLANILVDEARRLRETETKARRFLADQPIPVRPVPTPAVTEEPALEAATDAR